MKQFAIKKAHHDYILEHYHLVSAKNLKKDCFPDWGVRDPKAAMNKRAKRDQVLSVIVDGVRLFPIEQFNVKSGAPELKFAFREVMNAFAENKEITQEEMLYWLCAEQPLLLSSCSLVDKAIAADDLEQGWGDLKATGHSQLFTIRPIDCLLRGDKNTVLRLFYDWTDVEKDEQANTPKELINAVKHLLAIQRISIEDLIQE